MDNAAKFSSYSQEIPSSIYGTFLEHFCSKHNEIEYIEMKTKLSDAEKNLFLRKDIDSLLVNLNGDSAAGRLQKNTILCPNCGLEGTLRVKSTGRQSVKEMGSFKTCFPLCFVMLAKFRDRKFLKCKMCKTVFDKST